MPGDELAMISTDSDHPEDPEFPEVDLPPEAQTPEQIVRLLVGELVDRGRLNLSHAESIVAQVLKREALGSTAIGRATALPHTTSNLVDEVVGVIGKCSRPVDWPSTLDKMRVTTVCLLLTPSSRPGDGLRTLGVIARRFWRD
jgi:mannitol/fructose-specific phosphotransferase system IIA component (Ntr-type)